MEQEIKITAHIEPNRPDVCRFVVNFSLYPEGSAFFPAKEKAQGSPLAEKLFEISQVATARISQNQVTVSKSDTDNWRPIAGKIAQVIREHILSEKQAVSQEIKSRIVSDKELKIKVREVFEAQINPFVAEHGGHVDLIEVKNQNVYLRMGGGCQGCGMASLTLKQGIETTLREAVPDVGEILDVTDHAGGANPYYVPSGGH